MLVNNEVLRTYFAKLGLESEIADIYLSLYSNGPQSISELSRSSGVERTRIYRLIDQLLMSNLIEMEPVPGSASGRGIIKAAPVSDLRSLIIEREQATKNLADELDLIEKVLTHNSLSNPAARVQSHDYQVGIRRMLERELRTKTELVTYLHPGVREVVGPQFMDEWHRTFEASGLSRRALDNMDGSTGLIKANSNTTRRHITPDTFLISHRVTIYDDIVAYYLVKEGEMYGIELHNQSVADAERQVFNLLWEQAEATP